VPTLVDLVERLSFLAAVGVAGVFVTAGLLAISRDWRINVIALTVQYFFVALLLARQIRLEVAAVKGLVGWLICMMFYLTERRASVIKQSTVSEGTDSEEALPTQRWRWWVMSARASFSLLAVFLISVAAYTAALRLPLPESVISADITLACYLLAGLGLLQIGLNEMPMQVGFGLLTFLSGFDLFYVALEPSLAVAGLLSAVGFLIALAAAYLRTIQATTEETKGT
jgi:hypothetical protein